MVKFHFFNYSVEKNPPTPPHHYNSLDVWRGRESFHHKCPISFLVVGVNVNVRRARRIKQHQVIAEYWDALSPYLLN